MEENKTNPLLQIRDLHVHYMSEGREIYAVNGVSLDINPGETIGLVGETRRGKTTMALSVMKLIQQPAAAMPAAKSSSAGKTCCAPAKTPCTTSAATRSP